VRAAHDLVDRGAALAHAGSPGKDYGRPLELDTLLTLVIALGGIATGIGAIWAALAARRQAQLTERSLAQNERSLSEQNERLRLNLALDLLTRMRDRFESPHFRSRRCTAAKHLLDNAFVAADIVEVEHLNKAAYDVLDFFEEVGYLHRIEALLAESVQNSFGWHAQAYWFLCKPSIEKVRKEYKNPDIYEELEGLSRLLTDVDRERGIELPTPGQLHEIMEYEVLVGEESRTGE
jgi:hypothetical protein